MEKVRVEDAVGMVLAHDLTKIVPGTFKGAAFKKGYIIRQEDIEELKNIGKNHIYVVTLTDAQVHENEAAARVAAAVASPRIEVAEALEGKANMRSTAYGLLHVDRDALDKLNGLEGIALVTLHSHTLVQAGQIVAAAKIIPLTIERETIETAEQIGRVNPRLIDIKPIFPLKTGLIVTGTEVYHGRIQDRFGEVLKAKIGQYGGEFFDLRFAPDDMEFIHGQILELIDHGAEVILISGGMAVDADDVTPQAIKRAATKVVAYGVPLLPGSMGMVAYCNDIPLIGVPACAMYNKTTILDLILPRLFAKEHITLKDLSSFAHGGLCLHCEECHYPVCPFGK